MKIRTLTTLSKLWLIFVISFSLVVSLIYFFSKSNRPASLVLAQTNLTYNPGIQTHRRGNKYPHISIQQSWNQPYAKAVLEVMANYDVIQAADLSDAQVQQLKALNPYAKVMPFESVHWYFEPGQCAGASGQTCTQDEDCASNQCLNMGRLAPGRLASVVQSYHSRGYDGVYFDLWNDIIDTTTANQASAEIRNAWPAGVLIANYGTNFSHSYELNGFMWEAWTAGTFDGLLYGYNNDGYANWEARATPPVYGLLNDRTMVGDRVAKDRKTNFDFWEKGRYATGLSLLTDGIYVHFNWGAGGSPHWANPWYFDEFDVDIGIPLAGDKGVAKALDTANFDQWNPYPCLWVREFTNGLVIMNDCGEPKTVDVSLLAQHAYIDPNDPTDIYYRFQGGQQPQHNTGQKFNSVTLDSWLYEPGTYDWPTGDAIILVKQPQVVVAEIIIDDEYTQASADNFIQQYISLYPQYQPQLNWMPNNLNSSFSQTGLNYNPECGSDPISGGDGYDCPGPQFPDAWHIYPADSCHYSDNGQGSARWTFNIGVAGEYEVYEWHALPLQMGSGNVNYAVHHANGVANITINQADPNLSGRWNLLGMGPYYFNQGASAYVELTASGPFVADAIRLVFKGGSVNRPNITLNKSANISSASAGQEIAYTIHYHNNSQTPGQNVTIRDVIPFGTSYVQGSANPSNGIYTPSPAQIEWQFNNLPAGEQGDLEFRVKVN